jgi:hypothetical protein
MKSKALYLGVVLALGGSARAGTLWSQPFDGTGDAIASQNDTTGGFGNYSTAYDNFTLSSTSNITGVDFTGGYFNPLLPGTITSFAITVYSDNAGQPGANVLSETVTGNANETFLGLYGGVLLTYNYSAALSGQLGAGTYWLSVVPTVGFPPQWGWATGTGGDGVSYQNFIGFLNQNPVDLAFVVQGSAVPEPSTWAMMLLGSAGLGYAAYRRARVAVSAA